MLKSTILVALALSACALGGDPIEISGRYPHLAMFNHQGECGTGAVAPWADRLWVISYGPHLPHGSDDKLYEIDAQLNEVARPESVGGTPADRLIHRESNQLVIGPYFIDASRNVRAISPKIMPGRLTAAARHLTDPANKVYIHDMEGTLYEVDVHSLAVNKLFDNVMPGAHAKGAYSGQGHLIFANNGNELANPAPPAFHDPDYDKESERFGALAEWDGAHWSMIERRGFTDITGPGGIEGAPNDQSPIWAIGWDKRSVLLKLRDAGAWHTFRLPIADFSYTAMHGWYTEWPRIREVGGGKFLMNMHGGWYDFPRTFSAANTAGLRAIGSYLKITGDFAPWRGQIVFGCDDASKFGNPLLGQSQSNLWFSTWDKLKTYGRPAGSGAIWLNDKVAADKPSAPYLFAGYTHRSIHLSHATSQVVNFTLEVDVDGKGNWKPLQTIAVRPNGYEWRVLADDVPGEWIRAKADRDCGLVNVYLIYGPGGGATQDKSIVAALTDADDKSPAAGGSLRPLGNDTRLLWYDATTSAADGHVTHEPFAVGDDVLFKRYTGSGPQVMTPKLLSFGVEKDYAVEIDSASAIITDKRGRYRLPIGAAVPADAEARTLREIVTERFLLNVGGSFFMTPRPTAGGASRLKPICTHGKRISDFCSWRGLMVMSGCRLNATPDGHYFAFPCGPGLWFGDIDDLWKLGKPVGHGGPWVHSAVTSGTPSDPYLMFGYDRKTLELSHDSAEEVRFTVEVDVAGTNTWRPYATIHVPAGKPVQHVFPEGYSAHWVRLMSDRACNASAIFTYE